MESYLKPKARILYSGEILGKLLSMLRKRSVLILETFDMIR